MPNKKIAELISKGLRDGLTHPGRDGGKPAPIVLPMFRTAGMPKEMAELVDETATLLGEAIVALIEEHGNVEMIDRDKAVEMRIAEEGADTRHVAVHCRCDSKRTDPLMILTVGTSPFVLVDGKQLISGLSERSPEHPHPRIPKS